MEYAAARLEAEYPAYPDSIESRGDDWVCRDPLGIPPERIRNPSFAHGEVWRDVPLPSDRIDNDRDGRIDEPSEGQGAFGPGDIAGIDLDGDGTFSGWSGRIRGGRDPFAIRFSLEIDAPEGLIPLNAGCLDARDRDGNGVPDHRDLSPLPLTHAGIAHALDNLGVQLFAADGTRREALPSGEEGAGHLFQRSRLGEDLLRSRPLGGYRTDAEVRAAMSRLGYAPSEVAAAVPYLDLGPYAIDPEACRSLHDRRLADFPASSPICLAAAPRVVLEALWTYLKCFKPYLSEMTTLGADSISTWSTYPFQQTGAIIFPAEARAAAERVVAESRKGRLGAWIDLRRLLLDRREEIFPVDAADLEDFPLARGAWLGTKAELLLQAVAADPFQEGSQWIPGMGMWSAGFIFVDPASSASLTYRGWGVDRFPGWEGVQQEQPVPFASIVRVPFPEALDAGWEDGMTPFYFEEFRSIVLPSLTMAPPVRFRVRSASTALRDGARSERSGELRAASRLTFTSQEDFEAAAGGSKLALLGIRLLEDGLSIDRFDSREADPLPDGSVPKDPDGSPRTCPHLVSLPARHLRDAGLSPPPDGYPRLFGALALAGREAGRQGAALYMPCGTCGSLAAGSLFAFEADPAFAGIPFGAFGYTVPFDPYTAYVGIRSASLPGFSGAFPNDGYLDATLECWMVPGSSIQIFRGTRKWSLTLRRDDMRDEPASFLHLLAQTLSGPFEERLLVCELSETAALPDRVASSHHVAITAKRYPDPEGETAGWTEIRLFIDGRGDLDGLPMTLRFESAHGRVESLDFRAGRVDEMRFFNRALDPRLPPGYALPAASETRRLWRFGRFEPTGTFLSPTYSLDAPATLKKAQATGFIPPGFPPGSLRVILDAYRTAPGEPGHPALLPGFPKRLGTAPLDLKDAGPARSFRYRAAFDCRDVDGALDDSPVLESLWLTLRMRNAPAWSQWIAR